MTTISNTKLDGVHLIRLNNHSDNRGSFSRLYCKEALKGIISEREILQINHSITLKKGSVRGLHFQRPPHEEMKLIRCIKGRVHDVIVDLRQNSKTYLNHFSVELSAENNQMIVIPEGFAHGFQTLEDNCELIYLHTNLYTPASESGLNVSDPLLNIQWPLTFKNISERDKTFPFL